MGLKKLFINKTDSTFIQFFRYIFVGGGATVVQYLILILLRECFGIDANIANAFGFVGGLVTNYFISTYWVFDKSTLKNKGVEFAAFALIGIVGFGINQGLIWLFDKPLASKNALGGIIPVKQYYLVGQVLATGITFFWNFFARKILLFSKGRSGKEEKTDEINKINERL